MKFTLFVRAILLAAVSSSLVFAQGVASWETAATSLGAGYIATNIMEPMQADIGSYDATTGGGVSYEFVYNADVGGASSAFMGSLSAPDGDSAGLKFDQWPNSGTYGATLFGVADYTGVTPHTTNADTHVVFVADGTDLGIYVNGAFAETLDSASFALSGLTGIGHAYNHGNDGSVDALSGTLLGVAVYDTALDADQIAGNFAAYVPEPSTSLLSVIALLGLAGVARKRR